MLVVDAHERGMLAACRALAGAGYDVSATAPSRSAPGLWSRACSQRVVLPSSETHARAFADGLRRIVRADRHSVLLAGGDASLRTISEHRDMIEPHVVVRLPTAEVVERSLDKITLIEQAPRAGLSVPETVCCRNRAEALEVARASGFPIVVKPRHAGVRSSRVRDWRSRVAWNEQSVARYVDRYVGEWLLQTHASGTVYSCAGVMTPTGLRSFFFSRYVRTWPPDGGNCAFSESCTASPAVEQMVGRLLVEIGWIGIFELELLVGKGREVFALDFNPRPYGSLALAVSAGTSLPVVWCDWLLGQRIAVEPSRPGFRYRWEDGDVRHALWQLGRRDLAGFGQTIMPRRHVAHAYFSRRDPLPLLARLISLIRRAAVLASRSIRASRKGA